MKVLHVYKTYAPDTFGGIEKVIDQIAISTASMGVTSSILALTPEKRAHTQTLNGYTVHRIPQLFECASTPFSLEAYRTFCALAKDTDIIHYHFPWPFADMLHFAARIKKPALVTYHSDIIKQKTLLKLYQPLMNCFLADMQHIIATSPNYFKTSPVLNQHADKVSVIPIGLDEASYPEPSQERLQYWQQRFPGRFFLFIGVLRYYKGIQVLMQAAESISVPVLIAGSGDEPTLNAPNVHFIGEISEADKVALLKLCYGVILPSHVRAEAFGIALLEGALFAKPLISCEIGTGTSYINLHAQTGLVVAPNEPKALSAAMQTLFDKPELAAQMGLNARARYESHFTAAQMALSYVAVYTQMLGEK